MLAATGTYYFQLQEGAIKAPAPKHEWIKFEAPTVKPATVVGMLQPKLLLFDEVDGALKNAQDYRAVPDKEASLVTTMPWRIWLDSASSKDLAANAAAMSAVAQVLHMLHLDRKVRDDPFDVFYDTSRKTLHVRVTEDVEALCFALPPCIPKQSRVLERSEHPLRVPITVVRRTVPQSAVADQEDTPAVAGQFTGYSATFYVNPEWKGPQDITTDAQRADPNFTDPIWTWTGEETMHPFWAIRRLTKGKGDAAVAGGKGGRFNCNLIYTSFSVVCVGSCKDTPVSSTFEVTVPFITNSMRVAKDEELIMEITANVTTRVKRKETWKDDLQKTGSAKKLTLAAAKGTARGAKTANAFLEI
jgi:hypothetical protein